MVTDFQVIKKGFSTIYRVLDIETGEVLYEREEENANKAFDSGLNATSAYVTIRRQVMDDGRECKTVEQNGYVKLYPEAMSCLKDEVISGLVKLTPFIMPDGTLKDRKRRRYLTKQQALAALGFGRDKGRRIWQSMVDSGAVQYADSIIRIDRQYLARG